MYANSLTHFFSFIWIGRNTPSPHLASNFLTLRACRDYIQNTLARQFTEIAQQAFADSNIEPNDTTIAIDSDDPDGQSLLFWYPTVTTGPGDYIRPAVKIESGAKSALDPHEELRIVPYVSEDVPRLGLAAAGVTTDVAQEPSGTRS